MAFGYNYGGYPNMNGYYAPPMPDQLAQLRQGQFQQPIPQQQNIPQNPMMSNNVNMQQPVMPQPTNGSSIIWVNGEKEVDDYLIAPNNAVALWDKNNPVVYVKQADATGKPTTEIYDLVKRKGMQTPQSADIQSNANISYATKEELNALAARAMALENELAELKMKDKETAKVKKSSTREDKE